MSAGLATDVADLVWGFVRLSRLQAALVSTGFAVWTLYPESLRGVTISRLVASWSALAIGDHGPGGPCGAPGELGCAAVCSLWWVC